MFRNRKKLLAFACSFTLILSLLQPTAALADDTSSDSYAGEVHLEQMETYDFSNLRTYEATQGDLNNQDSGGWSQNLYFVNAHVTYWKDDNPVKVDSWTDATYVKKGDVICTILGSTDTVAIEELTLSLNRIKAQSDTYAEQIQNKEKELKLLSGYDRKIAALELKKLKSESAQAALQKQQQIDEIEAQIAALKEQGEKQYIADVDGWLLLPPDDYGIGWVQPYQVLYTILPTTEYIALLEEDRPLGAVDDDGFATVVSDSYLSGEFMIPEMDGYCYMRSSSDGIASNLIEKFCGAAGTRRISQSLASYTQTLMPDVVQINWLGVFDSDGLSLGAQLVSSDQDGNGYFNTASYDTDKRYHVTVQRADGVTYTQYVTLGAVSLSEKKVAILSGLQPGDQVTT